MVVPIKSSSAERPETISVHKLSGSLYEIVVCTDVVETKSVQHEMNMDNGGEVSTSVAFEFDTRIANIETTSPIEMERFIISMLYDKYEKYDMSTVMGAMEYDTYMEFATLAEEVAASVFGTGKDDASIYTKVIGNITTSASIDEMTLADAKIAFINTTKDNLATFLVNNPLESDVHSGIPKKYTVTLEKQTQLAMLIQRYNEFAALGTEIELRWNASGEPSEEWTIDDLRTLWMLICQYADTYVEQQRQKEERINSASSIDELKTISLTY